MSKKVWVLPVLVAIVLALGSGASFAMPSLGGPTGIVSVPNALVAPVGDLQLALSYQKVTESVAAAPSGITSAAVAKSALQQLMNHRLAAAQSAYGVRSEDFHVWGLQALTGVADGAELWAAYQHANSDFVDNIWGIGGKFQFLREPKDQAYVAAFASYQKMSGGSIRLYDGTSVDFGGHVTTLGIAATKDLTPTGVSGSQWASGAKLFGTAGLVYKKAGGDFSSDSLTRPYLGAEFVTADGTTLGLEYRWKDSNLDAKAVWSAVLKHNFPKGFSAEIGTTNADPLGFGTSDQNLFVRVGYSFPMGATK